MLGIQRKLLGVVAGNTGSSRYWRFLLLFSSKFQPTVGSHLIGMILVTQHLNL